MSAVTREDIETIVRRLDTAILAWEAHDGARGEGRLSPSTAANVWGDLVHAFDEAVRAKDPNLRVLPSSPCAGVRGPESGHDREGPILYSDELRALLVGRAVDPDDRDVPLYRRRVYAVAHYTMARRSELAALTARDVDLTHATITISKQVDRKNKTDTKKTKTRRTRTIDIEPTLLPLIKQLVAEVAEAGDHRLLRVPPSEDCAELLRKDLWTVGARDDRLHTEDATRTPMVFHCLRDSGLTHMAVRGDSPIVIQWRGGHTDFKTTQGYLDRGRVEARRIGTPLPSLPAELLQPGQEKGGSARVLPTGKTPAPRSSRSHSRSWRPRRELKTLPRTADLDGVTCGSGHGRRPEGSERARNSEPMAGSSSPFGTRGSGRDGAGCGGGGGALRSASMSARALRLATAEDLARSRDDGRREVVRGAIVEKAAPTAEHADAQSYVALLIKGPFQRRPGGPGGPGGWWILTEADIEFATHEVYRPDVAGWRRERVPGRPTGRPVRVRPDWVCEVLSPSTASRDLIEKMQTLRQCEVPHYWIVDPEHETLTVHRWTREGYVVALVAGRAQRRVRAEPFDAVEIDVALLFGDDPE